MVGAELLPAQGAQPAEELPFGSLVQPGEPLPPGGIYNSNRYMLRSLLLTLGCEAYDLGSIPDSFEATKAALERAAETTDVILSTGGMSVGEEDHIKPAVESLGALDVWRVRVKPGKPLAFGHVKNVPFIGIPGRVSTYEGSMAMGPVTATLRRTS